MATDEEIEAAIGCKPGSIGPVNLSVPVIADRSAAHLADFVCGANKDDFHLTGVNWERDVPLGRIEDLRNVVEGDPSRMAKATWKSAGASKWATSSSLATSTAAP